MILENNKLGPGLFNSGITVTTGGSGVSRLAALAQQISGGLGAAAVSRGDNTKHKRKVALPGLSAIQDVKLSVAKQSAMPVEDLEG